MGLWHGNERVVAEPHDNGKLAVVCVVYWEENEQDLSSLQFVSAATVLICKNILYFIYVIYVGMEFLSFYPIRIPCDSAFHSSSDLCQWFLG